MLLMLMKKLLLVSLISPLLYFISFLSDLCHFVSFAYFGFKLLFVL